MAPSLWLAFALAALLLSVSPGPGMFNAVNTALCHGWRAALVAILGLQAGLAGVMLLVGVGVGSLVAASPLTFDLLKWLGAAYLAWLGLEKWRHARVVLTGSAGADPGPARLFRDSFLVNLTNPKSIVFFAALFPQFIDVHHPYGLQVGLMGLTSVTIDILVMGSAAAAATRLRGLLRDARLMAFQNRLFGGLFMGAAALLASARL